MVYTRPGLVRPLSSLALLFPLTGGPRAAIEDCNGEDMEAWQQLLQKYPDDDGLLGLFALHSALLSPHLRLSP
jgi:hypothetical protein